MANTKQTIIDAMITALGSLSAVNSCTRDIPKPSAQKTAAPFVGVVSYNEVLVVPNSTSDRYACDIELILIVEGDDIEQLVDVVRDAMLHGMAATIGARGIQLKQIYKAHQLEAMSYSEAIMLFEINYVSTRGAA